MAHRRAPLRRRGARHLLEGRLRDEDRADRPGGRLGRRRAGQERSCPGAKGRVDRRGALREATTCRAFTTSSSQCS